MACQYDRSQFGSYNTRMRLLGYLEVADFVRRHPGETEVLGAWLNEVRHKRWADRKAVEAEFRMAEGSWPGHAVFRIGPTPVFVDSVIDYRNGVLLVTQLSLSSSIARLTQ